MLRLAIGLCSAFAAATLVPTQQPMPPSGLGNWSFDELILKNGAKFEGLILAETPETIRFQSVSRLPGRPAVTLTTLFTRPEIARINRLSDADRKVLQARLAELDPSGEGERKRMASLELVTTDWLGKDGGAQRYQSDHFTLTATGSEEFIRRSAVRLEQIYTAFTRFLPPTIKDARPTQIFLATNRADYKALLGPVEDSLMLHPALFEPRTNRVLCGQELGQLATDLQAAVIHHAQQLVTLEKYAADVRKLYRRPELDRFLAAVEIERKRIWATDHANGEKFDEATKLVFAVLYHEAFHAYVGTFVYPPLKPDEVKAGKGTGELPRWLNEGLAQVFETAFVEAGELRADAPNRTRLENVRDRLKGKRREGLLPLSDLLVSGMDAFLAPHTDQKAAADRAYLTSWALAYYLTFERRLIGTAEFRDYLIEINSGGDPRAAFAKLVKQDLAAFEKDWHGYLSSLQSDGTLG
ncbi:MAG TPA: DUF1570 domain-containing protein, partial [Gemmata sp.]|nr:DUF1570 domain-containing protein [Gemmata sp.]